MRVILSAAISADGYLDNCNPGRLILSTPEDWDAVHALRAGCDAILVGAGTLRTDNPALVIRKPELRAKREAEGMPADIIKIAISGNGRLDPDLRFFTEGGGEKILFTEGRVDVRVAELATVISRPKLTAALIVNYLSNKGICKLLVEGGSMVLSMFLKEKIWDEFRLAVAPVFVADTNAPTVVVPGEYPGMRLDGVERLGQMAVMHYVNESQYRKDAAHMSAALVQSRRSEPADTCFRVGAVVVTRSGNSYSGYTHETGPDNHAEEEAIDKALTAGEQLRGATIYATMEPCSKRSSKPVSCTSLIIHHGFSRVVFALREPDSFTRNYSAKFLCDAGIEVVEMSAFAGVTREINSHLLPEKPSDE